LNLPVIYIQTNGTGTPVAITPQNAWRYDEGTGLLYQRFTGSTRGRRRRPASASCTWIRRPARSASAG
jgi:hypothetical protein